MSLGKMLEKPLIFLLDAWNVRPTTGSLSGFTSNAPTSNFRHGVNERFYKNSEGLSLLSYRSFLFEFHSFLAEGKPKDSPSDHPAAPSRLFIQFAQFKMDSMIQDIQTTRYAQRK